MSLKIFEKLLKGFLFFIFLVFSEPIIPKVPKILPKDPILFEKVVVSNDINMRYDIYLKNNTSYTISLKDLEIHIKHKKRSSNWEPSLELLSPSLNTKVKPNDNIQISYRCKDTQVDILKKMDEGYLSYNSENNLSVSVKFEGKEYIYEEKFVWKPKMSDLRISDFNIDYVHEWSGSGIKNCFLVSIFLENNGDALPIFLGDKNKKLSEVPFVNIIIRRKKDGKIISFVKAYPALESDREKELYIYLDTYFRISPGDRKKLIFKTDVLPALDLIGDFDIIIGFDYPLEKTNVVYYHLFSDANWENNFITKTISLGNDAFEILGFYPEKISSISSEVSEKEYVRKENKLIYLKVKSYLPLNLYSDADSIKVYFNNELLRIFSIQLLDWDKDHYKFTIWVERPKNIVKGRFRVDISGVSKFSNYLEVSKEFTDSLGLSYFYLGAIPVNYTLISSPFDFLEYGDGKFNLPYGIIPINIEDINIKGKAPMSLLVALKPKGYTWLEYGKGWASVEKENPNADLSKYISSLSDPSYFVYVLVRPENKISWNLLYKSLAPKTLEADKRNILSYTVDEIKGILEGKLKGGKNELLIIVTYMMYDSKKDIKREVVSDMYWTEFKIE